MEKFCGRRVRPASLLLRRDAHVLACAAVLAMLAADGAVAQAAATPGVRAEAKPAATDAMPRFDVFQYVVEGNSVLAALDIELAVTPFLGERKTLRDVEAAREALEKRYHEAGYLTVLVSIPAQQVDGGEVRLQVTEAVVDRLKVVGAQYTLPSGVKAQVDELAEGNVPNFKRMQEQLAQVNRRADARVTPVLRAGKLPGTVEVQLDVDDQLPLHGTVELNNRQTPNTTETRVAAGLRYDNLWQRGHSVGLNLQMAPERPSDARVASLSYVLPTGVGNDVLSMFLVHSRSAFASLANAPGLGLLGNSDTFGLRYSRPLTADRDMPQTLAAGLDFKNIRQTLVLQGGDSSKTPIEYVPAVFTYNLGLPGEVRSSSLDLTATLGLRGLLGNSDEKFEAKRSGASASFMSLRAGIQHSESLARWTLSGRVDTQLATGPLVPTEQMVAGGAESVRGYLEGERAGDYGVRASIELRSPAYAPAGAGSSWRIGGLAFVDLARLGILRAVAPQADRYSLAGMGFGLRLSAPGGFSVDLDAARALRAGDVTAARSHRVHARAVWGY